MPRTKEIDLDEDVRPAKGADHYCLEQLDEKGRRSVGKCVGKDGQVATFPADMSVQDAAKSIGVSGRLRAVWLQSKGWYRASPPRDGG
jgi:hypothetical protein